MTLLNNVRVYGSFIEQPQFIRYVGQYAAWLGGAGGVAALTGADVYHAAPDERGKVLTRDALVLGSTALGTWAAARKFMALPTEKEAKESVEHYVKEVRGILKDAKNPHATYEALSQDLQKLVDQGKNRLERSDYRNIIEKIEENPDKKAAKELLQEIFEPEEKFEGFKKMFKDMCQAANPAEGKEEGELRKMGNFFIVGGLSVLSGLFGGIAANKVNGVKDQDATVNMVKEGVFQFIANIALCAVGAASAILLMAPLQSRFSKMGWAGKGIKTVGIGAGLSLGIFGGGAIANKLGTKVINPLCDKLQGKEPQPETADPNHGKRKIEFWDAILHLDDVPTAMALAGMEIVEPFIPLFFGFSGYRTGIGYRNDDSAKGNNKSSNSQVTASTASATATPSMAQPPSYEEAIQPPPSYGQLFGDQPPAYAQAMRQSGLPEQLQQAQLQMAAPQLPSFPLAEKQQGQNSPFMPTGQLQSQSQSPWQLKPALR
jgi:hypothetical protein